MDYYMTVEQVASELGLSKRAIYAATFRGRFRPLHVGRRGLYSPTEVEAYKVHLKNRWASKTEAQALYQLYDRCPDNVSARHWAIFSAYANNPDASYDDVGQEFHVQRQRVQQIVTKVITKLVARTDG